MHPNDPNTDLDMLDPPDPLDHDDSLDPPDHDDSMDEADSDQLDANEPHLIANMFHGVACVAMAVADAAGRIVQDHAQTYYDEQPYYTSALSGMAWVNELLTGHPDRIRCELGVRRHVFYALLNLLHGSGCRGSEYIMPEEQLAIFLHACVTGLDIRHLGEHFQRPDDMISKSFKHILIALSSPPIYSLYVRLPSADSPTPPEILQIPQFYPYFSDAIGAIDSNHITRHPSGEDRDAACNHKGSLTQNCLVACAFDISFLYILSGWEGSTADAYARISTDFNIPPGKYYLADAGFAPCDELLVPYCGVRYHLTEWGHGRQGPCNHKELFNLRHAMLRNVVERSFGVLKKRFGILFLPPRYTMDVQVHIPAALCLVHNVIRVHDPNDMMDYRQLDLNEPEYDVGTFAEGSPAPTAEARTRAHHRRDKIALQMWEDFNLTRQQRGLSVIVDNLL